MEKTITILNREKYLVCHEYEDSYVYEHTKDLFHFDLNKNGNFELLVYAPNSFSVIDSPSSETYNDSFEKALSIMRTIDIEETTKDISNYINDTK